MNIYESLKNKESQICVIGLGYVGLPVALEFAQYYRVIGFDVNTKRVEHLQQGHDPDKEMPDELFENGDITFTSDETMLKNAQFYIVTVPTPIAHYNLPDLQPLYKASETVGKYLKTGDYVVYESTVYPGVTEDECLPILEKYSGLKAYSGFKIGYSPERINPGDTVHTLPNILKVISGCDEETLDTISHVYGQVIHAGIHKASSIKVAEAAKVIENTQRDVNIGLMNELSIIFGRIGINTYEVLEAAGTKWNFLPFYPGLVGGHCIGVDPYYLTHKAAQLGYHAQLINAGRFVNDSMGRYIAKQTVKKILARKKNLYETKVLIMGVTFKENVSDIRNSRVPDIVREFKSFSVDVDIVDPLANPDEVEAEYGFTLKENIGNGYEAVVLAVNHNEYMNLDEAYFSSLLNDGGTLVDVKGIYRDIITNLDYWSL